MINKASLPILMLSIFFLISAISIDQDENILDGRIIQNINKNWQYADNNLANVDKLNLIDTWQPIDLPHTWNQWDAVDNSPGYRRDASWYQKQIFIENYTHAQYVLYFEGANISTSVYVNGALAGTHIGGYVGFEIDITPHITKGSNNTISVRVDNAYNPDVIPSQKADFFIYGGITRDVWLKILPKINLKRVAVTTKDVSNTSASTHLEIDFHNGALLNKDYTIVSEIVEKATQTVISKSTTKATALRNEKEWNLNNIENPKLWSPDQPNLYQVITQLYKGDVLMDKSVETIGYRWFQFEDHGAFFLNGERLLLRGTHRHEEHAGYGAAMPNEQHRKDIELIKGIGANFLRLGHYPQDPEVYRACDELGIIVWDELPWCRGGMGDKIWQDNTERLLKEQIKQNINHPSILFWSLGNEIFWLPDFENGDDESRINTYVTKLNGIAHSLDDSRMTALRKYYAGADLVDVFSPSIWSGWYAGVYTNYAKTLSENQKKYPKFIHMEYGGSSHVGRHTEHPIAGDGSINDDDWEEVANQVNITNIAKSGDWTENYIVDLFDWYLGVTETSLDLSGNAQWAFKDFGTPLRPKNAIPYLNQKGLVDRNGNPKDAYYVFKSYWSTEPFTYIESHTWTERRGPEGKARNLSVFSNCDQVALIHNNIAIGTKDKILGTFPAMGLNWDLIFTKGKNELIANGIMNGAVVTSDTMYVNYEYEQSGAADHIDLSYRILANGNYLVEAYMKDKNGLRVLDYEQHLYFSKDGNGQLLINYGTPTRSQVIEMANGYAAIELAPALHGKAVIEARNQDFKGSYITIDFDQNMQSSMGINSDNK